MRKAIVAGCAMTVTILAALGYAHFSAERQRAEAAAVAAAQDEARVNASRARARELLDKSTEQMIDDARAVEERKNLARDELRRMESRRVAAARLAEEQDRAERRCVYAFQQQHTGLEPVPGQSKGGPSADGDGFTFVFVVRLADSFRSDAVGLMTCETRGEIPPILTKIRR